MSNIFYDRSGKPHKIGKKDGAKGKSEERSPERSFGGKKKNKVRGEVKGVGRSKFDRDQKRGKSRRDPGRGSGRPGPRPRKPVQPNPDWIRLKGVIDKNKRGSAFLVFDRRDLEDLFIPRYYLDQLFHGDRVEVFVSDSGEIEDLKVLEHRFKEIFGRVYFQEKDDFRRGKKAAYHGQAGILVYERKKAKEEIYLASIPPQVKEGDWVKAEMVYGDAETGGAVVTATIKEVIGPMLPAIYDIQMVAGEFNLTEHHTFEAVKQAESYKLEVPGKDEEGRTDLRHLPLMTIDGERARDFDDAVYVESLQSGGFRLWVAIADVSHYVKQNTPLDDEAYARATSVYFPERAFHMLPRALSEELCSLKPNVPRLCMACSIDYDAKGVKSEVKLYDGIMESRRRATYTEIEAEKNDPKHATMFALYRILRDARFQRGSIDFDFPESEIILDEKTGEPNDIVVRERNDAHRLIEEFMIAANESVTEWMLERKLPFIYRIHEEPSPEAIEKFRKLARSMGMQFATGGVPRPEVLAAFIRTLKGNPAEPVLATALLRSMRQAIYSATHGEHYGLASDAYTHFTSPIRRYPDLIVHRQLRAALQRERNHQPRPPEGTLEELQGQLEESAEHCSYRERIASEAERESIRFKQVRLMAKHMGEEFEGKINGMTDKGMFVQLWHPFCEGMVQIESMTDDWYSFNEERMVFSGRKKKRTFQIGDKVKIQVVRVDLDTRQVEFELRD
ncbi:MAG: ribonuclease R [Bdellovibrionales bacterium]|nr:ribonuclease R [Bdellovibrionales bacterium]